MAIEIDDTGARIGGFIIRLACGLLGLGMIAAFAYGLISWLRDSSGYVSVWTAMIGDNPLTSGMWVYRSGYHSLWRLTPDGMLPAVCAMFLSVSAIAAAIFHRPGLYFVVIGLIFTLLYL